MLLLSCKMPISTNFLYYIFMCKMLILTDYSKKTRIFTNLMIVVFPTPGGPISNNEAPALTKSLNKLALPDTALPTRQVKPIIAPFLFLIALIRCKVLLIPARLSIAKSPTYKSKKCLPSIKPKNSLSER